MDGFQYARTISTILHDARPRTAAGKPDMSGASSRQRGTVRASADATEAIHQHLGRRVKRLRLDRGWSLEALENASGVSRSMLSQIEREQANPTLAVTLRIARAFGLTLGELLEMPGAASTVTVIRAGDHAFHYKSDQDCRIRTLSP